jgi:hypothetical protein
MTTISPPGTTSEAPTPRRRGSKPGVPRGPYHKKQAGEGVSSPAPSAGRRHGGRRAGAGRPPLTNPYTRAQALEILEGLLSPELPRLLAILLHLANGVKADIQAPDGSEVWHVPPNRVANIMLLDRLLGTPRRVRSDAGPDEVGVVDADQVGKLLDTIYGEETPA